MGRFISADTMVPEPGNPQSYNRYAYVRNNPMNFTDPSGHREIGANENDLLFHDIPFPTLEDNLGPTEPVFHGLPVDERGVNWISGYGPNGYAAQYADPNKVSNPIYSGSGGLHSGIDLGVDPGTVVYANVEGIVILPSAFPGDAGPNVTILLANGMIVVYGHVIIDASLSPGTKIIPGTQVGVVKDNGGNTHVHLALRDAERSYNPAYFFTDESDIGALRTYHYHDAYPEGPYSMTSIRYQPDTNGANYWVDGPRRVGIWR